jgi:phage shock protein PspC (stress-responsive transcriptional regulator)
MNKYYRSESDKIIAGVCGGLAQSMKMDPLLLRILFVFAAMINGVGLAAYVLLWLFMAPEQAAFSNQDEMMRHNVNEMRDRARQLGQEAHNALGGRGSGGSVGSADGQSTGKMLLIGAGLVFLGLMALLNNIGLLAWVGKLWPLGLIALGVVLLLNNLKERH